MMRQKKVPTQGLRQQLFTYGNALPPHQESPAVAAGDGFSIVSVQGRLNVREWQSWLIRSGLSQEVYLGVSRSGIYADFT